MANANAAAFWKFLDFSHNNRVLHMTTHVRNSLFFFVVIYAFRIDTMPVYNAAQWMGICRFALRNQRTTYANCNRNQQHFSFQSTSQFEASKQRNRLLPDWLRANDMIARSFNCQHHFPKALRYDATGMCVRMQYHTNYYWHCLIVSLTCASTTHHRRRGSQSNDLCAHTHTHWQITIYWNELHPYTIKSDW